MEKYLGVKVIEAEPMSYEEFHQLGSSKEPMKPQREGYKVIYPDGYVSWSPKEVFEEAYRRIDNLNFGLAIEALKKGYKVARKGWNGKNQYIELATCISYKNLNGEIINPNHDAIGNKALAFIGTSGIQLGWLASQADMLAEDWTVVE